MNIGLERQLNSIFGETQQALCMEILPTPAFLDLTGTAAIAAPIQTQQTADFLT